MAEQVNELPGGKTPDELRAVLFQALVSVTGRDPAAIDDHCRLDELGLDSLMITELLLEVEDLLGVELPLEMLGQIADAPADTVVVVGDLSRLLVGTGDLR